MSHASRLALLVVIFFLLMAAGIALALLLFRYQLIHSQDQWCQTIRLLTSHPVAYPSNAAANPSRVESYQLYEDFVQLRTTLGC